MLREDVKGISQVFVLVVTWLYKKFTPQKDWGASIGDVLLKETLGYCISMILARYVQ